MDPSKNKWLEKLEFILETYLGESELDNEFLANEMGISTRQFYRKTRELTNQSPNQYIRQYKLQKALEFIHSGQYQTVQEISFIIGFKNSHYFSKAFEKKYGESPLLVLRRLGYR